MEPIEEKKTTEETIKEFALQNGASVVGIASVAEYNEYVPKFHRPVDILPEAKSFIVLGGTLPFLSPWVSPDIRTMGRLRMNPRFMQSPLLLAGFIEGKFKHYAIAIDSGGGGGEGFYPQLSMKLAAEMAGLGTRGLCSLIINPELGGTIGFSGVLTTMPLQKDGRLEKPVCPSQACVSLWQQKRTTFCLQTGCPAFEGEIEDGQIKWQRYYQQKCFPRAQSTSFGAFCRTLLDIINESDPEKRKMMALSSYFQRMLRCIMTNTETFGQCFECMRRCPYGSKNRSLEKIDGRQKIELERDQRRRFIGPELYEKYKDEVVKLTNLVQGTGSRGLSDREIADKLGIDEGDVREIRTIAELDIPVDRFWEALEFKDDRCKAYFEGKGLVSD